MGIMEFRVLLSRIPSCLHTSSAPDSFHHSESNISFPRLGLSHLSSGIEQEALSILHGGVMLSVRVSLLLRSDQEVGKDFSSASAEFL